MALPSAIFISLPCPFLKVINCNILDLCYGVLVVGSMLRVLVEDVLCETLRMSMSLSYMSKRHTLV